MGEREVLVFLNTERTNNDDYFPVKEIADKLMADIKNTWKICEKLNNRNVVERRVSYKPLRREYRLREEFVIPVIRNDRISPSQNKAEKIKKTKELKET